MTIWSKQKQKQHQNTAQQLMNQVKANAETQTLIETLQAQALSALPQSERATEAGDAAQACSSTMVTSAAAVISENRPRVLHAGPYLQKTARSPSPTSRSFETCTVERGDAIVTAQCSPMGAAGVSLSHVLGFANGMSIEHAHTKLE